MTFWVEDGVDRTDWDILYLGGETWPGVCQIEPVQERSIDVAKRRGAEPTLTDNGYNPARLKATLMVWEEEQWDSVKELIPRFSPRKNDSVRTPLEIWHPATDVLGIESIVIETITLKHPTTQVLVVEIGMLQWFPETQRRRRSQGRSDGGALTEDDFSVDPPDSESNL